jgi:hypothetical protein
MLRHFISIDSRCLLFLTPLAQTELCMNLEDKKLLGFSTVNSSYPLYRTRAGRNLTPETSYDIKFLLRFDWTLAARGNVRTKLRQFGALKRLNVEHRTPNIEHSIMMTLRLIYLIPSEP